MSSLAYPKQFIGLIGWLAVCYATSAIGAIASIGARDFYAALAQPAWAPPGWLFGPVWTTLYTLMAISAWLIWRDDGLQKNKTALLLFLAQLAINAVWSWLFFAWGLGGLAFLDILVLVGLVATVMAKFAKANLIAGILLLPYLLWILFAALLNFSLWQNNPELLI